jgi:hypothetical protein
MHKEISFVDDDKRNNKFKGRYKGVRITKTQGQRGRETKEGRKRKRKYDKKTNDENNKRKRAEE